MADDPDCLGLCSMEDGYCTGCGRSEEQIAAARGGKPPQDRTGTDAVPPEAVRPGSARPVPA
jgi:hypothetical protein